MKAIKRRQQQVLRRVRRVRSKIHGTASRPRLSVYRSNQHVFVQAINDDAGATLASGSDLKIKSGTKLERAQKVAQDVVTQLKKAGIKKVVFDRGGYRYHGRVRAVADALRAGGIEL